MGAKVANVPDKSCLEALRKGDAAALQRLDAHGLAPMPGETQEELAARLEKLMAAREALLRRVKNEKKVEAAPGIVITRSAAIPSPIIDEALAETERLYAVRPDWVPGYFANESFGVLWGGCSVSDPESGLALFIIRKNFREKRRWLFYDRCELLAHELTHAAHQNLNEWQFEEYFAYRTSKKTFRRWFGNCFVRKFDALGFLLPILLLPVVEFLNVFTALALPVLPFWILAAIYPGYLILRNQHAQRTAQRARKFLVERGVTRPDAVLFRLTAKEIAALAREKVPDVADLRQITLEPFGWNALKEGR